MRRLSVESFRSLQNIPPCAIYPPNSNSFPSPSLSFSAKKGKERKSADSNGAIHDGIETSGRRRGEGRRGRRRRAKTETAPSPSELNGRRVLFSTGRARACCTRSRVPFFPSLSPSHLFFSEEEDSAKKRDVQQRNRATIVSSRARTRRREERK